MWVSRVEESQLEKVEEMKVVDVEKVISCKVEISFGWVGEEICEASVKFLKGEKMNKVVRD